MSSERFSHWTGSAGLRNLWVWRVATVRDQDAASQLMDILHLCAGMRSVQLALLICLNTEPGPRWIHDTFPKLKQLNISLYIYTILYMYIIVYYFCPLSLSHSPLLSLTYFPWTKISNENVYIHRISWSSNATVGTGLILGAPNVVRCQLNLAICTSQAAVWTPQEW